MAIAGQATQAFPVRVADGQLEQGRAVTTQNHLCQAIDAALVALSKGETVTVRASDMFVLRRRLEAAGVTV